jgi:hypothetical protein
MPSSQDVARGQCWHIDIVTMQALMLLVDLHPR